MGWKDAGKREKTDKEEGGQKRTGHDIVLKVLGRIVPDSLCRTYCRSNGALPTNNFKVTAPFGRCTVLHTVAA